MRHSAQRQCVYDILSATTSHPDAQWVYSRAREVIPNISMGTVYRNLGELVSIGKVKAISAVDNVERYDANTDYHAHFVCRQCGSIIDIDDSYITIGDVGHVVDSHELMLYGTCSHCKNRNENN